LQEAQSGISNQVASATGGGSVGVNIGNQVDQIQEAMGTNQGYYGTNHSVLSQMAHVGMHHNLQGNAFAEFSSVANTGKNPHILHMFGVPNGVNTSSSNTQRPQVQDTILAGRSTVTGHPTRQNINITSLAEQKQHSPNHAHTHTGLTNFVAHTPASYSQRSYNKTRLESASTDVNELANIQGHLPPHPINVSEIQQSPNIKAQHGLNGSQQHQMVTHSGVSIKGRIQSSAELSYIGAGENTPLGNPVRSHPHITGTQSHNMTYSTGGNFQASFNRSNHSTGVAVSLKEPLNESPKNQSAGGHPNFGRSPHPMMADQRLSATQNTSQSRNYPYNGGSFHLDTASSFPVPQQPQSSTFGNQQKQKSNQKSMGHLPQSFHGSPLIQHVAPIYRAGLQPHTMMRAHPTRSIGAPRMENALMVPRNVLSTTADLQQRQAASEMSTPTQNHPYKLPREAMEKHLDEILMSPYSQDCLRQAIGVPAGANIPVQLQNEQARFSHGFKCWILSKGGLSWYWKTDVAQFSDRFLKSRIELLNIKNQATNRGFFGNSPPGTVNQQTSQNGRNIQQPLYPPQPQSFQQLPNFQNGPSSGGSRKRTNSAPFEDEPERKRHAITTTEEATPINHSIPKFKPAITSAHVLAVQSPNYARISARVDDVIWIAAAPQHPAASTHFNSSIPEAMEEVPIDLTDHRDLDDILFGPGPTAAIVTQEQQVTAQNNGQTMSELPTIQLPPSKPITDNSQGTSPPVTRACERTADEALGEKAASGSGSISSTNEALLTTATQPPSSEKTQNNEKTLSSSPNKSRVSSLPAIKQPLPIAALKKKQVEDSNRDTSPTDQVTIKRKLEDDPGRNTIPKKKQKFVAKETPKQRRPVEHAFSKKCDCVVCRPDGVFAWCYGEMKTEPEPEPEPKPAEFDQKRISEHKWLALLNAADKDEIEVDDNLFGEFC
jgi:hypothetical protein